MVKLVDDRPLVIVDNNKLVLTKSAVEIMKATAGGRIAVNYWNCNSEETFPVIGKAETFTDHNDGNRLTKSSTVSYRGSQRDILLEYGNRFILEEFKPNIYKLSPIEESVNDDLSTEMEDLQNLENEDVISF